MDKTTQERIKADAEVYADAEHEYTREIEKAAYIAGATAWANKTEQAVETALHKERNAIMAKMIGMEVGYVKQIHELVKVLGFIKTNGLCSESTALIDAALQQWKDGKKVDDPCPHCGKELSRDRNLCCRACGKEVEREAT